MKRFWQLAAALALIPSVAHAADVQGEREILISRQLPGYTVAQQEVSTTKINVVEIPDVQTPDYWTRKITTQWFKQLADDMEQEEYAAEIRSILQQTCPDALMSPVRNGKKGGFETFYFRAICPATDEGNRITFMLLAFAGKDDMFVKQVAFRGKATSEDFLWGHDFLNTVRLCKIDSDKKGCPGYKAKREKGDKKTIFGIFKI
ncbi:MAG: hypothetical protein R3D89_11780 [Sphingomonadaceae bacterium]|jgi:hypothetical protein